MSVVDCGVGVDIAWVSVDRYGLSGLFWMTDMGGRVVVFQNQDLQDYGDFQDWDDAPHRFHPHL